MNYKLDYWILKDNYEIKPNYCKLKLLKKLLKVYKNMIFEIQLEH